MREERDRKVKPLADLYDQLNEWLSASEYQKAEDDE
jgi:hypothetical protein